MTAMQACGYVLGEPSSVWWWAAAVAMSILIVGCEQPSPQKDRSWDWLRFDLAPSPGAVSPAAAEPSAPRPADTDAASTEPPLNMLSIDFQVLRVRAPQGTFSQSGKIWNAIDEEVISPDRQVLLRRNGLRIGVGRTADWPQIKAVLDAASVETDQKQQLVNNGLPLNVEVLPEMREQLLFLFRPDGSMAGRNYGRSRIRLRVDYAVGDSEAEVVELELTPEIVMPATRPRPTFLPSGREYPAVEEPTRPLWEIAARLRLDPGTFVVVGPAANVHEGHLAGTLLLVDELDARRVESMYFIAPRMVRRSVALK